MIPGTAARFEHGQALAAPVGRLQGLRREPATVGDDLAATFPADFVDLSI